VQESALHAGAQPQASFSSERTSMLTARRAARRPSSYEIKFEVTKTELEVTKTELEVTKTKFETTQTQPQPTKTKPQSYKN
jgi:hypothetical protein